LNNGYQGLTKRERDAATGDADPKVQRLSYNGGIYSRDLLH
jgi:hypothetical protein